MHKTHLFHQGLYCLSTQPFASVPGIKQANPLQLPAVLNPLSLLLHMHKQLRIGYLNPLSVKVKLHLLQQTSSGVPVLFCLYPGTQPQYHAAVSEGVHENLSVLVFDDGHIVI